MAKQKKNFYLSVWRNDPSVEHAVETWRTKSKRVTKLIPGEKEKLAWLIHKQADAISKSINTRWR